MIPWVAATCHLYFYECIFPATNTREKARQVHCCRDASSSRRHVLRSWGCGGFVIRTSLAKTSLNAVHGALVFGRRVRVLARHIAARVPTAARILDVGAGDGSLAAAIATARPARD